MSQDQPTGEPEQRGPIPLWTAAGAAVGAVVGLLFGNAFVGFAFGLSLGFTVGAVIYQQRVSDE